MYGVPLLRNGNTAFLPNCIFKNSKATKMKLKFSFLYLSIAVFCLGLLNLSVAPDSAQPMPLEAVKTQFHQGLKALKTAIHEYDQAARALGSPGVSAANLKEVHLKTRLLYKEVEFLLEYFDHSGMKRYLNGAPLPTVEKGVPEIRVLEPIGLQTLDELVFGEEVLESKEEIIALTRELVHSFDGIYNYQSQISINHRHVFESIRLELSRIFTLGLTGFDTPGSVNAIPEATRALSSIAKAIEPYNSLIKARDQDLPAEIASTFSEAIDYLQTHQDFDTFDRLHFLKTYINPLYEMIYRAHRKLGVETSEETNSLPNMVNYHATNLFSDDLLRAGVYAGQKLEVEKLNQKIALGKLLFFDPILSANNERACASCHDPARGFTDGMNKSLAMNHEGQIQRNSPTVINSVYAAGYFYDLREEVLERQTVHVVRDKKEFNTDFLAIVEKLSQSGEYQKKFEEAYPNYQLSKWSVTNALAHYVISLRSFNSPFDQYVRGEQAEISEAVKRGFNLFMGKAACGTCHFAPTFNGTVPPLYDESETEVLGVPAGPDTTQAELDADLGRIASGKPENEAPFYAHSFKTTTVRNVALTAPYMHNGVYNTLEEVVDFYNRGGGIGLGIDVPYQTLPDTPLNLNEGEKKDLVAFMESLTDTVGMTAIPVRLPQFEDQPDWNQRKIGGEY